MNMGFLITLSIARCTTPIIIAEITMDPCDYLQEIGFVIWCDITESD